MQVALGGMLALAAAIGIGRFVYTPILPGMIEALGWSKIDAGLVASANFLGYLVGALLAGSRAFSGRPRGWLLISLTISVITTAAMAAVSVFLVLCALRFVGGVASAFVIVCASTVVLERIAADGRGNLAAVHFAGVGAGIAVSAAVVAVLLAIGADWRALWLAAGAISGLAAAIAALSVRPRTATPAAVAAGTGSAARTEPAAVPQPTAGAGGPGRALAAMIVAYGLFGFGYVITATFLVTIVRESASLRPLEPWIWITVGLSAVPSVTIWQRLGTRIGLTRAFAAACLLEAFGVGASVEWATPTGLMLAAALLGGTFMGLTALGLMSGRQLSSGPPQRVLGWMSGSFAAGQMIGPTVAGLLSEYSGSLRSASLVAAGALVAAAMLAATVSPATNDQR